MFCFQCEQTVKGQGCDKMGVCGKTPEVAALQDQLIHGLKGLSAYAVEGRKVGINDDEINTFTCKATFSTLTNVDFDPERFVKLIHECAIKRSDLKEKVKTAGGNVDLGIDDCTCNEKNMDELIAAGEKVNIKSDPDANEDILSLQQMLIYGIKGLAAYADHTAILEKQMIQYLHSSMKGLPQH